MSTMSDVALWRRLLLVAIVALVGALVAAFTAPTEAHAIRDPTVVLSAHKGWVYVRDEPRACPMIYPTPAYCYEPSRVATWQWTSSGWRSSTIAGGTSVYAWPYASGWHWIWTQRTGWLAIQTSKLTTGYSCTGWACPVF
jgi:hypothetical protein